MGDVALTPESSSEEMSVPVVPPAAAGIAAVKKAAKGKRPEPPALSAEAPAKKAAAAAAAQPLTLKKKWSSNGEMSPEMAAIRYYLSPTAWNIEHLLPHVASKELNQRDVIFHGPSQSGKTTRMRDFCVLLKQQGYIPV